MLRKTKLKQKPKNYNLEQTILYTIVAIAFFSYFAYSKDKVSLTAGIVMLIVVAYWFSKTLSGWRRNSS